MLKSNLYHEDSKMISKNRIIGTTSNSCWQELEAKIYDQQWNDERDWCQTQCQLEFGAIILFMYFLSFQGRTWSYDKVNFERMRVGGRQSYGDFVCEMTREEASRICDSRVEVLWRWCMHGWPRFEIMQCVPIRYIRNKYLIYIILDWGVARAEDSRISRFICSPFTNTGYGQFVSCVVALIITVTFDPLDIENNSV